MPKKFAYLPEKELCAGNKVYHRIDGYNYYQNYTSPLKNRRCPYCPKFRRTSLRNRKKRENNYSCEGISPNSGAPLWKWMTNKTKKARILHLH